MKNASIIAALAILGVTSGASHAALVAISNSDFEATTAGTGEFGFPGAANWDNASTATHAAFAQPNNGALGAQFVFTTSASGPVQQALATTFTADSVYTLSSFASWNGSPGAPDAVYTLGYDSGGGTIAPLNSMTLSLTGQPWDEYTGATYTTGAAGPEIGQPIVIQIQSSNTNGLWVDNVSLNVDPIPEPSAMLLGALGLLGLVSHRRR